MTELIESGQIAGQRVAPGRYMARLIEGDRWGSSGYYPREVIERDGPTVWPAGTPIYLDHPSESERLDRPERSVRDLAGKIATTPTYQGDGLYAEVQFYPHTAPILEALWEDVGMSIRASGTTEPGERDGRTGPIITELAEGVSVDVVTRAGAGGRLVAVLESARQSFPSDQAGTVPEHKKMKEIPVIEISEADHKALTDRAGQVETLEAERDNLTTQLEETRRLLAEARATSERATIDRVLAESGVDFTKWEKAGICADLPRTDGVLDVDAFTKRVEEAAGDRHPGVTGVGPSGTSEMTEAEYRARLGIKEA